MGNYRFKLSDMLPNAWFYRLKYMSTKPNEEHRRRRHHPPKPTTTKKSNDPKNSTSSPSLLQSVPPPHSHVSTTGEKPHNLSEQRKSYYFTRELIANNLTANSPTKAAEKKGLSVAVVETPRKSSSPSTRRRRSVKRNAARGNSPRRVSSSISAGCRCRATFESVWTKMDDDSSSSSSGRGYGSGRGGSPSWSTSCNCSVGNDSFISDDDGDAKESNVSGAVEFTSRQIPPIITKKKSEPTKTPLASGELTEEKTRRRLSVKVVEEETTTTTTTWSSAAVKSNRHKSTAASTSPAKPRLSSASSQCGVRLRTNSPRIRIQGRKSVSSSTRRAVVSESLAVVKASRDPQKDFRKSMVEMIMENDIRKSKDLEELLACYLSLNSNEYHDMIINVFKQIWFDFVRVRLK